MSPVLPHELLQAVLLASAGVVIGMLIALIVQRAIRRSRASRTAELDAELRRIVLEASIAEPHELSELLDAVRGLDRERRAHLGRTAYAMLHDVTGEAAEQLRMLVHATGTVPSLFAATKKRDAVRRADAAEALGVVAPDGSLEALCELALDRSPEVRAVAVRALGGFDAPAARERIVAALASDSGVPASVAASALLQQGGAAADRVRRALDDHDAGVRRGAARVAGLLQVPGAGAELVRLLADEDRGVRWSAIRALEQLPVREAVAPLLELALRGGLVGETAARTLASMPQAWTGDAMRAIRDAEPGVRRAAGLSRQEAA